VPEQLITLPLRIGWRIAGLALRPLIAAAGHLLQGDEAQTQTQTAPPSAATAPRPAPARPAPPRPRRTPTSRADVPDEPVHVEQETVVVAEVADPGAEDGAGAQVSVAEPWDGYSRMKAADVIDRLAIASPEEIAVV
jgi:hypothetical protein